MVDVELLEFEATQKIIQLRGKKLHVAPKLAILNNTLLSTTVNIQLVNIYLLS